jgi:hypothetical protein
MDSGQTFVVDEQAVQDIAKVFKRNPDKLRDKILGHTFIIPKSLSGVPNIDAVLVRGARIINGNIQRGRPAKFPRFVVARLLGEMDDPSIEDYETKITDTKFVAQSTPTAPSNVISQEVLAAKVAKEDAEREAKALRILSTLPTEG